MKNLIIISLFLFEAINCFASYDVSIAELSWRDIGNSNDFYGPIKYCDAIKKVNFRVGFFYSDNVILYPTSGNCNIAGEFGSNPYKYTVSLYRNNVIISTQEFQSSSCKMNCDFNNIDALPGFYKVNVVFKTRAFWWTTRSNKTSVEIECKKDDAFPSFTINGISPPADDSPIDVNIAQIRLNASNCTCESKYQVLIMESDRWWSRTYDYEWSFWFTGQAVDNINLQQLTTTYSILPYFTGSPARQGSPLISGNLSNGQPRYYRVAVCTQEPSAYNCKTALIRVNY